MQQIVLPTSEIVLSLHDAILAASMGRSGILHPKQISAALERPLTHLHYSQNCTLHMVCAILLDSFARNHIFVDGNKRTALMVAIFTYMLNDIYFNFSPEMNLEFERLALKVVNKKPTLEEIATELEQLVEKFKEDTMDSFTLRFKEFLFG